MQSTSDDTHSYIPRAGHGLPHDPFNAIVGARPIGRMGTHEGAGHVNPAPSGLFNALNDVQPIAGFASIGEKDTLRNARATGDFGISAELGFKMHRLR